MLSIGENATLKDVEDDRSPQQRRPSVMQRKLSNASVHSMLSNTSLDSVATAQSGAGVLWRVPAPDGRGGSSPCSPANRESPAKARPPGASEASGERRILCTTSAASAAAG